jgi:surfeit locus 1 family protein
MKMRALVERKRVLTTIVVLLASAGCVRLGFWQLDRLAQRRAFNAHVAEMGARPVLSLPTDEDLPAQEYRSVRGTGTYDFTHQVAIRNQILNGQYGYHLLTPLQLEGVGAEEKGSTVLVDRGWIPASGNDRPQDWRAYDEAGSVTVQGAIRLGQAAPAFGGMVEPTLVSGESRHDFWLRLNLEEIRRELPYPVLPVYIHRSPAPGEGDPPVALALALDVGEGPHLGYAIQWFGFAGLLIVGYSFRVMRQAERNP